VEAIRQITITDYWQPEVSGSTVSSFNPLEQSYCITGDFNVVLPRVIVKYRISDPIAWTLAVVDPEKMLRDAVGAELVHTIGEMEVDYILTEGKSVLANAVKTRSQARLDAVGAGLRIVSIEINELIPPRSILPDFQAVQSAAIEKETVIRNAQTYQAQRIPQAEAEATQIETQAEAYSVTTIARANADANAFTELLTEYRLNPDVVRERLRNEYLARALVKAGSRYVAPGPPIAGRLLIPPAYGL
jgi:membrane protease subunit HflK